MRRPRRRRCVEHARAVRRLHPVRNREVRKAHQGSQHQGEPMKQIGIGVIGVGWCGGIRAETLAKHPLVKSLHLAETRAERLDELSKKFKPASATADYKQLLNNREIEAVYIS